MYSSSSYLGGCTCAIFTDNKPGTAVVRFDAPVFSLWEEGVKNENAAMTENFVSHGTLHI